MKQARVFVNNLLAGILTEDDAGYEFRYDSDYLKQGSNRAVSLTLPFNRFSKALPAWDVLIEESFLPDAMKSAYRQQIATMAGRLALTP